MFGWKWGVSLFLPVNEVLLGNKNDAIKTVRELKYIGQT